MESAIRTIGIKITINDLFYFSEITHAGTDSGGVGLPVFQLYNPATRTSSGSSIIEFSRDIRVGKSLGTLLDDSITGKPKRTVILAESCYSGFAVTELDKDDRVIMSSTDEVMKAESTTAGRTHYKFTYNFNKNLGKMNTPKNLFNVFDETVEDVRNYWSGVFQNPQINDENLASVTWV